MRRARQRWLQALRTGLLIVGLLFAGGPHALAHADGQRLDRQVHLAPAHISPSNCALCHLGGLEPAEPVRATPVLCERAPLAPTHATEVPRGLVPRAYAPRGPPAVPGR